MSISKRIIPCLDVQNGRTVKGTYFEQLEDMGDPLVLAQYYTAAGADELVFLDISATQEQRSTLIPLVTQIAKAINIPFTVGGGVRCIEDVDKLLSAGADKVCVNSAAVNQPALLKELSHRFGSQCIVLAIDSKRIDHCAYVFTNGGRKATTLKVVDWAKQAFDLGIGEILLTSMDHDGAQNGFDNELIYQISSSVSVPIIASGGAGNVDHFVSVFKEAQADAALAARIFHNKTLSIPFLKTHLQNNNINVRL